MAEGQRVFSLLRCTGCGFVWVADPWTDSAAIYDDRYYRGEGSDPSVDYAFEYHHPEASVRQAEWDGILAAVSACEPPEIHVSYFTPRAMTLALEGTGFRATPRGTLPGDASILRYKILKGLRRKRQRAWQGWPWSLLTPVFHRRLGMGEMPLGRAV